MPILVFSVYERYYTVLMQQRSKLAENVCKSLRTELVGAAAGVAALLACWVPSAEPTYVPPSAAGGGSGGRDGAGQATGAASGPRGWYSWLRNAGH